MLSEGMAWKMLPTRCLSSPMPALHPQDPGLTQASKSPPRSPCYSLSSPVCSHTSPRKIFLIPRSDLFSSCSNHPRSSLIALGLTIEANDIDSKVSHNQSLLPFSSHVTSPWVSVSFSFYFSLPLCLCLSASLSFSLLPPSFSPSLSLPFSLLPPLFSLSLFPSSTPLHFAHSVFLN